MKIKYVFAFLILPFFTFASDLPEVKLLQRYEETGIDIFLSEAAPENAEVHYKLYSPFYKTYAEDTLQTGEKLYIPYGTEICIWSKTKEGKHSPVKHFIAEKINENTLMQVINPVEGIWNENQILFIKSEPDTQIMYSVDGSDPEQSGLLYTEPVTIEKNGAVDLRIKAVDKNGFSTEKKISYTVSGSGKPSPKFTTGNIYENLQKPKNTDKITILNWYFIDFNFNSSVYYILLNTASEEPSKTELVNKYDEPLFTERKEDEILYWYCEEANGGKINKLLLPKKPSLLGCPLTPVNAKVELSFEDLRYTYSFDVSIADKNGSLKFFSSEFKNGTYIFDSEIKTEKQFDIKITALLDNIVHGEFKANFEIDKLPPEKPNVIFNPSFSPANKEVKISFNESDNAELVAEIYPADYIRKKNEIILTGAGNEKTLYSINIYNKDKAGNKSPPVTQEFTIERNVIFVDTNLKNKNADGNPSNPFSSIREAVDYINRISFLHGIENSKNERWKIFLRGDSILNEAVLITRNIKFLPAEKRSVIRFSKNAGFVINGSALELEDIDIFRRERPEEPREVPILYISNGAVKLRGVKLHLIEGGAVLKAFYSHIDCSETDIISEQTNYCTIFNLNNCSAVLQNTSFTGKGLSAAAISCSNCNIEVDSITSTLSPGFTARFLEAWNSEITLGKLNCIRNPETQSNKDTAVWYNRTSKMDLKYKPIVRGYAKSIEREP